VFFYIPLTCNITFHSFIFSICVSLKVKWGLFKNLFVYSTYFN
jgi:hypothetical protein